jgi:hypothetical protein
MSQWPKSVSFSNGPVGPSFSYWKKISQNAPGCKGKDKKAFEKEFEGTKVVKAR